MGVLMFVTAHVMMSDSVELKNLKKTNTFMILLLNIQCVLNIYCRMELAKSIFSFCGMVSCPCKKNIALTYKIM